MSIKVWALSILATLACGACSEHEPASMSALGRQGGAPAPDQQTRRAVSAARTFLATLSSDQRKAVLFAFDDQAQRVRWSNLPDGIFTHAGVRWGELGTSQRAAFMDLLEVILSPKGVAMVQQQMDAEDILKASGAGGPPDGVSASSLPRPPGAAPGPLRANYGSEFFYLSFLGEPSESAPWILQFGGHHLGLNATVVGRNISLSPSLSGGQPLKYVKDGKPVYIVEDEVKQSQAMLAGLSPEQRRRAVISTRRIDMVLGPGHDGEVLQPEGLPGSSMTAAQKARFLSLIEARLDILNEDDLQGTMARVRETLDQTHFGWWGPVEPLGAAYFRVTGPRLLIEFSPQVTRGDATNHAHNMYRDPTNEYGSAWTASR